MTIVAGNRSELENILAMPMVKASRLVEAINPSTPFIL